MASSGPSFHIDSQLKDVVLDSLSSTAGRFNGSGQSDSSRHDNNSNQENYSNILSNQDQYSNQNNEFNGQRLPLSDSTSYHSNQQDEHESFDSPNDLKSEQRNEKSFITKFLEQELSQHINQQDIDKSKNTGHSSAYECLQRIKNYDSNNKNISANSTRKLMNEAPAYPTTQSSDTNVPITQATLNADEHAYSSPISTVAAVPLRSASEQQTSFTPYQIQQKQSDMSSQSHPVTTYPNTELSSSTTASSKPVTSSSSTTTTTATEATPTLVTSSAKPSDTLSSTGPTEILAHVPVVTAPAPSNNPKTWAEQLRSSLHEIKIRTTKNA